MSDSFLKRVVDSFEARSERVAMRIVGDDSQVYTFGETLRQVRSIASQIEQHGVRFGDRVALIGENHPCWAIAYLAILYRGAVCVPLDPHGEIETLTNFFENSEAKLAFIGPEVEEKFRQIEERLERKIPVVDWAESVPVVAAGDLKSSPPYEGGVSAASADGVVPFTSATNEPPRPKGHPSFNKEGSFPSGDDIALLIYTSGTTGTPKGVPLTHGNILAELDGINEVLQLTDKEKILSLLPLFHAYLQIVNLWVATTYGCEVGYLKELSPAELGSAMKEFKPTILTTVPRLWYIFHKKIFDAVEAKPKAVQMLFRTMLATNGALRNTLGVNLGRKFFGQVHESFGGNLRIAISAGSRFDEDVATDFHKLGFTILQGYGLTETSGAATATHEGDNRVGSVGKPMKGVEIKIDNPDKNGNGEVLIKGGIVFKGYYQNPTATADAFIDGWFRSGDLGRIDNDGHLHIVGRAKDVIVLPSGKNVHPEDLEAHYLKTPLIEEMAIIGIADKSEQRAGAEKLAAVVVPDFEYLKQAKIANSKEAVRYALDDLGRELPEYQRVRDYIIRAEPLPRTGSNKVKRFELKKQIESGAINGASSEKRSWQFSSDDNALLATPAAQAVVSAIRSNAKDADLIHPSMNLEIDFGLDSLARAETFAALEHMFSTEFAAEEAAQALTIRDVIELIKSVPPASAGGFLSSPPYEGGVPAALGGRGGSLPHRHEASSLSVPPEVAGDLTHPIDKQGAIHDRLQPPATAGGTDRMWPAIIREATGGIPEIEPILKNRPIFTTFAWIVYRCFNLFCRVFMHLEVTGLENLHAIAESGVWSSKSGAADSDSRLQTHDSALRRRLKTPDSRLKHAFLICPNHQSFLDPFIVCSNYPLGVFRNTFHVGASMFFESRFMRFVARMLNVVPIDQETQLMRAMKAGAIGLKHGKVLNIYPEGERAYDGHLHDFKKGAAILATELDLPILPVALDGVHKVWPRGTWRIRPAKVKLRFGTPFYARDIITSDQPSNDQRYETVTAHLKQTISAMIAEMRK